MNRISIFGLLAALVVSCRAEADPILAAHVAFPHNLHDPIGVQKVHVAPFHSPALSVAHLAAAPAVAVKYHGTVAAAHHAPVAVPHHAPVAVPHYAPLATVPHHAPVAVPHYAPLATVPHHAPVAVSKTVVSHAAPVAHVPHAKVGVVHHAPVVAHHAPAVAVAHAAPVTYSQSQYHSQDELGQYAFGYNAGNSARDEVRDAYGNVRGSFSYVDSYGNLQTQHYVADDYGFRVYGTDLPVDHGHRYKRSYGTYPASTGPLVTVAHVAPAVHAPVVPPVVHKVAPFVHKFVPAVPVVHKVAPFVHNVAPAVHAPAVVHPVPVPVGYSGYNYYTGPSVTSYRSYHPW